MARARELLIVGAGLTGSLTASLLSRSSVQTNITVWDKARGCGGRFTTSYSDNNRSLHVDMGAQYITRCLETSENIDKNDVYKELLDASILTPFRGIIEGSKHSHDDKHYVAPKGMSSICRHFLDHSKASVHFKRCLKSVSIDNGQVLCRAESGVEEIFDGLVLTLPAPQLLQLQGNLLLSRTATDIVSDLSTVQYSSRYALGLFYNAETVQSSPGIFDSPWSAKYCDHPVVRYMCWDNLKRGVETSGATLLVHTSVPYGIEQLDTNKDQVKDQLLEMVGEMIPGLPRSSHSYLLRWRYSQVRDKFPGSHDFVVMSQDPLVVATGDSFSGSNFDNCLRAAMLTSEFIAQ